MSERRRAIGGDAGAGEGVAGLGADQRPSAYRRLWRNRNYRNYFAAGLVSSLGDWTGLVALQVLVSALYAQNPRFALFGLGGVMMARLLPSLIVGPVAGVVADRYDRKRLMVVVDVARGVLFIFVALSDNLTALFTLTFMVECLSLLYLAAKDASLPVIAGKQQLTEANQLNLLLAYGTLPLGAVIATAATTALTRFGLSSQEATVGVLLLDAVTFFVAAALVSRLRLPPRPVEHREPEDRPGVVDELREGLRFIADLPIVRSLIVGVVGVSFGAGVVVTLGPQFVSTTLSRPATDWPRLMTAVGVGLVVGIAVVGPLRRRFRMERMFPLSLAATGAIAAIMSALPTFGWALAFGALLGAAAGLSFVMGYTLLQSYTTDEVRGRTMAAFYTATRISLFSALGISPFLASAITGSLLLNGNYLRLSGIRITLFLGAMVGLYAALQAMRGMYRATNSAPRTIRLPGAGATPGSGDGLFIAFEGVEGAGKSTQVAALVAGLEAEGQRVLMTREPGGVAIAERIRSVLLDPSATMEPRTETLLYAAARAEHVAKVVAPALAEGTVVVCDRFVDSSLAYQGFARQVGDGDVLEINRWAVGGLLPDVVVLLELTPEEGLRRVRARTLGHRDGAGSSIPGLRSLRERRGGAAAAAGDDADGDDRGLDRLEAEDLEFHRRVARGYSELARRDRKRFVVVAADADADTVARRVRSGLLPWLPARMPTAGPAPGTSRGTTSGPAPATDPGPAPVPPPGTVSDGTGEPGPAAAAEPKLR